MINFGWLLFGDIVIVIDCWLYLDVFVEILDVFDDVV